MRAVLPDSPVAKQSIAAGVSRETFARLEIYADLLVRWQARMNLVAPSTLDSLWSRHMLDSAQLLPLVPQRALDWIDMGAGAGFPGLVMAMLRDDIRVTLIESRKKKCMFLREVAEATGISKRVTIMDQRIEALPHAAYDIISARALASLKQVFDWGLRFTASSTQWILPKGRQVKDEILDAQSEFDFAYRLVPSQTDSDAAIVVATDVLRRRSGPWATGASGTGARRGSRVRIAASTTVACPWEESIGWKMQ